MSSATIPTCLRTSEAPETDHVRTTHHPQQRNVFSDLGLPDAEDLLAKANLALHIRNIIKAKKLTQKQAAELLGLDQPKVSSIVNGRLDGFSTDRLMRFLNDLGCDVTISRLRPATEVEGTGRVCVR